jgi:hypothetical protein
MHVESFAIIVCVSLVLSSAAADNETEALELQAHPLYAMELYAIERPTLSAKLSEAGETKERADMLVFRITQLTAICSVNELARSSMPQSSVFLSLLRTEDRYDGVTFKMEKIYSELELQRFYKYLVNVTDVCDKVAREEFLSR